ncbi:hypothetical protein NDA11_005067 [Ustilago hordei]|nr:hypothetical protein NDA11_005067 [Ustilago hordei]
MSNLLHSLADSYDSEINTAEKKLTQAHGLLKQIQSEIEESAKVADGLHHQAKGVEEEHKRVDSLQLALKHGTNKRARDHLERRWAQGKEAIKRARLQAGLEPGALLDSNAANKQDGTTEAGADDANKLIDGLPAGSDIKRAIAELKKQLGEVQQKRTELVDKFVTRAREQGTGRTMAAYRRLIAAGCGGIAPDEVDAVVGVLCELLQEGHAGAGAAGSGLEGDERARDAAMMLKGAGAAALAANASAA